MKNGTWWKKYWVIRCLRVTLLFVFFACFEVKTGSEYLGNCNQVYLVPKMGNAANH